MRKDRQTEILKGSTRVQTADGRRLARAFFDAFILALSTL